MTARRTSLVALVFVLFSMPLYVSAQIDVGQPVQSAERAADRLRLTIDAPARPLALGDEVDVTFVATNVSAEAVADVRLFRPRGRGLVWVDAPDDPWLTLGALAAGESRVVVGRAQVNGIPPSGRLRAGAMLLGRDARPAKARFELLVPGPPEESADVPAAGGETQWANGRVRLVFPAGWNERDAHVRFQLRELYRQSANEVGRLLLFDVAANDGAPIAAFDAPVAVELRLGDLAQAAIPAGRPLVMARRAAEEAWTAVESSFDPTTGIVSFTVDAFAAYQAITEAIGSSAASRSTNSTTRPTTTPTRGH